VSVEVVAICRLFFAIYGLNEQSSNSYSTRVLRFKAKFCSVLAPNSINLSSGFPPLAARGLKRVERLQTFGVWECLLSPVSDLERSRRRRPVYPRI